MKQPNALEFDEDAARTRAADKGMWNNDDWETDLVNQSRWQHAQDKIIIDKLLQVIREQREAMLGAKWDLEMSGKWNSSEAIVRKLNSTDKILKEMGVEL